MKPVVQCYLITPLENLMKYSSAVVQPLNHPIRSNNNPVLTSQIQSITITRDKKSFETNNSIYEIVEKQNE